MWRGLLIIFMTFGIHLSQENLKDTNKQNTFPTTTELFSTSEFITELDYNISTFFNTTETPITTSNGTFKFIPAKKVEVNNGREEIGCLCNLRRTVCDVGCCCDKDCTYEKKKIFEQCEEITEIPVDKTSCQYFENEYMNYTMHRWEVQNNDFLCVAKTNLPPTYILQRETPILSYTETKLPIQIADLWPQVYTETSVAINISELYAQGVPLKYIPNNSTVEIFKLGESFFTSGCDIRSNVTYLHDIERHCALKLDGESQYLNAHFMGNILFVAKPDKFNITLLRNKFLTCPEPICLKPKIKICSDVYLRNCSFKNGTEIQLRCHKEERYFNCVNILDSFQFILTHNGIEGIKNITLLIHLVNDSYESAPPHDINQKISVVHEWNSAKKPNCSDFLSGNPGYLIGKPILVANLVNGTIVRDSENYQDNFLVLPHEDMGVCEIGEYTYQPIEFGYSTILSCKIKGTIPAQNDTKPEEICRNMQLDIFKYWGIRTTNEQFANRSYGLFGNANSSILDDWREILFEKQPKEILVNVTGSFSNKNNTLSCINLVPGMNVNIYHAKVDLEKLVNQEKVLGITNEFHLAPSKSFTFNITDDKIFFEFDLDTRVSFLDITSQKLRRIIDAPSLTIKLPSDFFYPFVKMRNEGRVLVPQLFFVTFSLVSLWI